MTGVPSVFEIALKASADPSSGSGGDKIVGSRVMKWTAGLCFILCGFLLLGGPFAQEMQVFTCDAVLEGKIQHKLKIEMLAGKITDFRYTSIAPNGHSCDIGAKRNRKNSDWQDEGQSTVISTRALGQDSGTVRIEKGGNSYKLTVLSSIDLSCGLQGYIAPIVILHTSNKKCELHEAEKNTK